MPNHIQIRGDYDPRFEPVAHALRKQVADFGGGGAASVYLEGRCVVDIWAGQARHDGTPWERDTMSICFSGTKGVTATAVHILDWDLIVGRLAETEPDFRPGTANGYHAITFGWLVGELIHRVSGMAFSEFIQKRIVEPLALDGLYIGEADGRMDRLTDLVGLPALRRDGAAPLPTEYRAPPWMPPGPLRGLVRRGLTPGNLKEIFTHPAFWKACLPSMNGVCTARSLAKMYAALSLGGELNGVRLVREDIVRQAAEVQSKRPDKVVLYPLHWRLGYHRADALLMDVPNAFGHFGMGGAGGWANPELELLPARAA